MKHSSLAEVVALPAAELRPRVDRWAAVAIDAARVVARHGGDESERIRQLRRIALEAENLAAILATPIRWEGGRHGGL